MYTRIELFFFSRTSLYTQTIWWLLNVKTIKRGLIIWEGDQLCTTCGGDCIKNTMIRRKKQNKQYYLTVGKLRFSFLFFFFLLVEKHHSLTTTTTTTTDSVFLFQYSEKELKKKPKRKWSERCKKKRKSDANKRKGTVFIFFFTMLGMTRRSFFFFYITHVENFFLVVYFYGYWSLGVSNFALRSLGNDEVLPERVP